MYAFLKNYILISSLGTEDSCIDWLPLSVDLIIHYLQIGQYSIVTEGLGIECLCTGSLHIQSFCLTVEGLTMQYYLRMGSFPLIVGGLGEYSVICLTRVEKLYILSADVSNVFHKLFTSAIVKYTSQLHSHKTGQVNQWFEIHGKIYQTCTSLNKKVLFRTL